MAWRGPRSSRHLDRLEVVHFPDAEAAKELCHTGTPDLVGAANDSLGDRVGLGEAVQDLSHRYELRLGTRQGVLSLEARK